MDILALSLKETPLLFSTRQTTRHFLRTIQVSSDGIFKVPEEFSFSRPLMNSYSLNILTMSIGMAFECTGFLKGPPICVGPFPPPLIYGLIHFGSFVLIALVTLTFRSAKILMPAM